MKRKVFIAAVSAALAAVPLLAGALTLRLVDPHSNPEATAKNAVVTALTTACNSPEKTVISATAEGIVNGERRRLPLKVIRLSTPGLYGVAREWPAEGVWAVRMVVTNPDYRNYATGLVTPIHNDTYSAAGAKQFYHAPTTAEVEAVLKQATLE